MITRRVIIIVCLLGMLAAFTPPCAPRSHGQTNAASLLPAPPALYAGLRLGIVTVETISNVDVIVPIDPTSSTFCYKRTDASPTIYIAHGVRAYEYLTRTGSRFDGLSDGTNTIHISITNQPSGHVLDWTIVATEAISRATNLYVPAGDYEIQSSTDLTNWFHWSYQSNDSPAMILITNPPPTQFYRIAPQ